MQTIGFIGLGHMGLPMAMHLVNAGYEVTGFDLQRTAQEAFLQAGGKIALTAATAVNDKDCFITMVQTAEQVKALCLGETGLYAHAKPRALHMDCSTIDVASSRMLHDQALACGLRMLDAPVSGGVKGAEAAGLTFMIGGDTDTLEQARPILSHMGKQLISTGGPGTGQAAKICNNMMLGISMIATSEAFLLAESLGLSAQKLFDVVTHASGQCWAMSHYAPLPGLVPQSPANDQYKPGFAAAMMLKDLQLSQQSAESMQVNTALGALATRLYAHFVDAGMGEVDFSAILQAPRGFFNAPLQPIHKDKQK